MADTQGQITEDQAAEALQQLTLAAVNDESEEQPVEAPEQPEPAVAAAEAEPEVTGEAPAETTEAPADDDVESLKTRLATLESESAERERGWEERSTAIRQRFSENERILRDRHLKKSNAVNQALQLLKASRGETGVPEAEIDRVMRELESTMNPASASYAPPPQEYTASEDQAIVLNGFLNEKGMTTKEADEFAKWIRTEAQTVMPQSEQIVAAQSLDGFLRLAHLRFLDGQGKKKDAVRSDAAEAVRSVQRTQRAAAKAASASPSAPRKQTVPSGAKEVDVSKFTSEDISALLRQSVEQYK